MSTAILTTVLAMITSESRANDKGPWYMDFQPIFERSYGALEGGKTVQKTESLSSDEVDRIINKLATNSDFIALAKRYTNGIKGVPEPISDEIDADLHAEISNHINILLEGKGLRMAYFFSNSISLEIFQRLETGRIGEEN